MSKKVGLFFGSFNPVHMGHIMIGGYFAEQTDLDEVWFVVSPHNPMKDRRSLLSDQHRLEMLNLATEEFDRLRVTDIEFRMPKPSYTVKTLAYLSEKHPDKRFVLIIGSDNLLTFHKWKNYEHILRYYEIYVYPRVMKEVKVLPTHSNIKLFDAPLIEISSTFIRNSIKGKKCVRYFLPEKVYDYMMEMHFYEK